MGQTSVKQTTQHSTSGSIILHLLPGFLAALFYVIIAPMVEMLGFPPLFALLLAGLFVLVPFEFGHMFREAKGINKRFFSLRGVVVYREAVPLRLYLTIVPVLVFLGIVITLALSPVDQLLRGTVFAWLPSWFYFDVGFAKYSKSALVLTALARLGVDGVVAPVMEEAYFRGHLLPSLSRLGRRGASLNAFLFTVYHFWQPWNYPSIFWLALLLVLPAWWKRNVYLSMLAHGILNFLGALLFLVLVLRG